MLIFISCGEKMITLFALCQTERYEFGVFSQSGVIEISGMSFSLSGDIQNGGGNIHLNETQSYSAETVVIPSSVTNFNGQSLLSRIMVKYNAKLRSFHIG